MTNDTKSWMTKCRITSMGSIQTFILTYKNTEIRSQEIGLHKIYTASNTTYMTWTCKWHNLRVQYGTYINKQHRTLTHQYDPATHTCYLKQTNNSSQKIYTNLFTRKELLLNERWLSYKTNHFTNKLMSTFPCVYMRYPMRFLL
jgi:hypothetical protein